MGHSQAAPGLGGLKKMLFSPISPGVWGSDRPTDMWVICHSDLSTEGAIMAPELLWIMSPTGLGLWQCN